MCKVVLGIVGQALTTMQQRDNVSRQHPRSGGRSSSRQSSNTSLSRRLCAACCLSYDARQLQDFCGGKHIVLLGASWATIGPIADRATFRNWYQKGQQHVFAKFRCCVPLTPDQLR